MSAKRRRNNSKATVWTNFWTAVSASSLFNKAYQALSCDCKASCYQQPGKEAVTEEFNRNKGEYGVIFSHHKFKNCMNNVEIFQNQQEKLATRCFWQQIIPGGARVMDSFARLHLTKLQCIF